MGRLFHILYATAHDDRYYQPAHISTRNRFR